MFLNADHVLINQNATTRDEVLKILALKAIELGIADDENAVYQSFVAREDEGITGMTEGFAIPHAKDDSILAPAIIVFKNNQPLDWPSFDDRPVDIAIGLLVPNAQASTTHLKLLSKVAVLLMDDDFKKLIRCSENKDDIVCAINHELEKD